MYIPSHNTFFSTLKILIKKIKIENHISLISSEESSSNNCLKKNNSIQAIFIYNNEGTLLIEKIFNDLFREEDSVSNIFIEKVNDTNLKKENFQKIISKFLQNLRKMIKEPHKFNFIKISFKNYNILILDKSNLKIVGIFQKNSLQIYFQKLLLIHIYISIINFISFNEPDKNFDVINIYTKKKTMNINNNTNNNYTVLKKNKTFSFGSDCQSENDINFKNYCQMKIYQKFYLKYIVNHFSNIYANLIFKENISYHSLELYDIYLIDITNKEILFSLNKINQQHPISNIKHFKKIFYHIFALGKILESEYNVSKNPKIFYKFECIGTYPRLIFYVIYIPVLNGCIEIHAYLQKKISSKIDKTVSLNLIPNFQNNKEIVIRNKLIKKNIQEENVKYKEFITTHGNNSQFNIKEIRYLFPPKLKILSYFFYDFFESNEIITKNKNPRSLICNITTDDTENIPIYFDYEISKEIKDVINGIYKETNIEDIYDNIINRLLIIFKNNYNSIINDSYSNAINYSIIQMENTFVKNQVRNSGYNEEYLANYVKSIFKFPQKNIILDYFDTNLQRIKTVYTSRTEDSKFFVNDKENISLIRNYNDNNDISTFNIKGTKSSFFASSFNESFLKPLRGSSINYKEKRKIFNENLSANLKRKMNNNNKSKFHNLSDDDLNNRNKTSNFSESFDDANNTNQLFLKDNSNILSKLNISKNP